MSVTLVNAVDKAIDAIAKALGRKIENVSADVRFLRNGDTRVNLSFLVKKGKVHDDHKTPDFSSAACTQAEFSDVYEKVCNVKNDVQ